MIRVNLLIVLIFIGFNSRIALLFPSSIKFKCLKAINNGESNQSDKIKIREALEYLKENDKEWLNEVIGDSLDYLLDDSINNYQNKMLQKSENNIIERKTQAVKSNDDIVNEPINRQPLNEIDLKLLTLGYSEFDVSQIKDNLKSVILEKNVQKPRKGLPDNWIKSNANDINQRKDISNKKIKKSKIIDKKPIVNEDDENNKTKFRWQGSLTNDEKRAKVNKYEDEDRTILVNGREVDEDSEIQPLNFWPDLNEFKDMLLDESKFRINLVGDWTTPLVKSETKWRYNLYRYWLDFLDQGVGDTFDVMEEDSDYQDEPVMNNSKQREEKESFDLNKQKAQEYKRWVENQISNNNWSDLSQEEMISKRNIASASRNSKPQLKYKQTVYDKSKWFNDDEDDNWFEVESDEDSTEKVPLKDRSEPVDFKEQWRNSETRKPIPLDPPLEFSNKKQKTVEYNREVLKSIKSSDIIKKEKNKILEDDDIIEDTDEF